MVKKLPTTNNEPIHMCAVCGNNIFFFLFSHHNDWQVKKCSRCGLVQVHPVPSEKEVAALYHEDMGHFEPYLAQLPVHEAYFGEKVRQIQRFRKNTSKSLKLLDIGCALGVLLSESKKEGFVPLGIDISHDAVEYCKKHRLTAIEGTMQSLKKKLGKATFNVVTAFEIIEHERDPLGMVKRIYEVLNNGGMAIITTPNHGGMWRKLMGKWWFGYQHPEHLFFFDPASITYLFKKAGFKTVRVERDTPRPFPLSFAFTRAADYFPWISRPLRWVGKKLEKSKLKNPLNPWDDMIVFAIK
jgi:2-polyprenyl-3-methyl-5-hydroxy-6-metoxy-1,4-benzoquinol methylase